MQESMGLIRWRDGLERTPSGDLARELVMPRACSSAVWVTRDGTAYRRYYNSQTCAWTWGEALEVALDRETQDRVGYNLPTGWRSLELCIATAWLHRAEGSTRRAGGTEVHSFSRAGVHSACGLWPPPSISGTV